MLPSLLVTGHKEVMFIHAHYSHLSEIISGGQRPSPKHQDKEKRFTDFFFSTLLTI